MIFSVKDWSRYFFLVVLSVAAAMGLVALIAVASTTISTNVVTGGTLSVTGLSTLGNASSTDISANLASFGGTATSTFTVGGFVGVGSSTPWGLLSSNANALGAGVPQFVVGSSTATNFIVANGGQVGIGTTSPFTNFSVQGNGNFSGTLTGSNLTATGTLSVTGLTTLGNATTTLLSVGASGTSLTQLLKGSCALTVQLGTIAASSSAPFDCAVTGAASGDIVLANLATTSGNVAFTTWTLIGAKASTTAGFITVVLRNDTGQAANPSATGLASTTNYIVIR